MIKKPITALASLALIAGCTINTGGTVAPKTTIASTTTVERTTTTAVTQITEEPDPIDVFLGQIKSKTTLDYIFDDATLVRLAKLVCQALDNGVNRSQLIDIIISASVKQGWSESQVLEFADLLAIGVESFCPWNLSKLAR
jgi:hypothetical protein